MGLRDKFAAVMGQQPQPPAQVPVQPPVQKPQFQRRGLLKKVPVQQKESEPVKIEIPGVAVQPKPKIQVLGDERRLVPGKDYWLITRNDERLMDMLMQHLNAASKFGFDFETSTEEPLANLEIDDENFIVGISFAWKPGSAAYLPIRHDNFAANWDVDILYRFIQLFQGKDKLKIAHNIKFEAHWLAKLGIKLGMPVFDPMLAVNQLKLLYNEIGLKPLVEQVFNYQMLTYDEVTGFVDEPTGEFYKSGKKKGQPKINRRQRKFNEVPVDATCLEYTCADSDWVLQLSDHVIPQLQEAEIYDLVTEIDIPLALCLVDMERNGWHTDHTQFERLGKLATEKMASLKEQLHQEMRRQLRMPGEGPVMVPDSKGKMQEFNFNSSQQLQWLLFDQLKLPVIKKSKKTKLPSTDSETLEKLGQKVTIPLFKLLLEYKKYQKIHSTYVEGYGSHVRTTGRIHTTIDQVYVRTGRFSSAKPNLQNSPRAASDPIGIRNIFVAPAAPRALVGEDTLYLFSDYSQIELRVFAWYSGDPIMRDAFMRGQDIHSRTAWEMFELYKPWQDPDPDGNWHDPIEVHEVKDKAPWARQRAKSINFGIIYGMQAKGLANDIWKIDDDEHVRQAQGLLNRYYSRYPRVTTFQKEQIAFARRNGYVTTMFNRMRVIEDIHSHNRFKRSEAERQCMNTPIQGSASEIIKLAMVRLHQNSPEWLPMIMQIHDELIFEPGLSKLVEAAHFVKDTMEMPVPGFDIPILAECAVGYRWGEKKDLDLVDGKGIVTFKEKELAEMTEYKKIFLDRLDRAGVEIKIKREEKAA